MSKHQPDVQKILADASSSGLGFGGLFPKTVAPIQEGEASGVNDFIQYALDGIDSVKPFDCAVPLIASEPLEDEPALDIEAVLKSIEGIKPFDVSVKLRSLIV